MAEKITSKLAEFAYLVSGALHLDSPIRVFILVLDITIVTLIAFYLYKLIKKTRAEQIFKGILVLFALLIISNLLDMVILNFLLTNLMTYGILMFIVVFQPELRSAFEKIGRSSKLSNVFDMEDNISTRQMVSEIVKAVEIMSLKKIGVLIVIQRNTKVSEILKDGVNLSARVSSELIQNIFMPRTPLHDGAVIIEKNQVLAAKCILPLTSENNVEKGLGTRHRAAVGISEISDALVVVVSEETGTISVAENGKLKRGFDGEKLMSHLLNKLSTTKGAVKPFRTMRKK